MDAPRFATRHLPNVLSKDGQNSLWSATMGYGVLYMPRLVVVDGSRHLRGTSHVS